MFIVNAIKAFFASILEKLWPVSDTVLQLARELTATPGAFKALLTAASTLELHLTDSASVLSKWNMVLRVNNGSLELDTVYGPIPLNWREHSLLLEAAKSYGKQLFEHGVDMGAQFVVDKAHELVEAAGSKVEAAVTAVEQKANDAVTGAVQSAEQKVVGAVEGAISKVV